MNRRPTRSGRVLSIILMAAVGSFYSLVTTAALAQTAGRSGAELSVVGSVTINGTSAISGATVFSESRIRTAANSSAIVNLGRMGRLQLGPDSEMTLRFSNATLGGQLSAGRATASAPAGVAISIATSGAVASSTGEKPVALVVDVTCGNTRVAASRSEARVVAGSKVDVVAPGGEVSVGEQTGAPGRCARLTTASQTPGLSAAALTTLILAGVGGSVAGVIAASQADNVTPSSIVVSGFRP